MGPFETGVVIVAIVMAAKVLSARYARKEVEAAAFPSTEVEDMRTELRKLKDRVAVLERLATDSSASLAREIDNLR